MPDREQYAPPEPLAPIAGTTSQTSSDRWWLERSRLHALLDALSDRGFEIVGPVVREGAMSYDRIESVDDLPRGWSDLQSPGSYRLENRRGDRVFGIVNGPSGLKPFLFAPHESLLQISSSAPGAYFEATETLPTPRKLAIIGVRACDLAALGVQDRVFLGDQVPDPYYASRREGLLLIAVSCTHSAPTCFCVSMSTGPEPCQGFDLALTEFDDGFVLLSGSGAGSEILAALQLSPAPAERLAREAQALERCAAGMERKLDAELPSLLYDNLDHPRWADVGERCLSCGNCTMVCPTCFCHSERDLPSVDGSGAVRVREWDSCFNPDHGRIHGMHIRARTQDRYRLWLVHKLASWIDQFGTSGCVGCGRCISWCPVGIDLCAEVAAIAGDPE